MTKTLLVACLLLAASSVGQGQSGGDSKPSAQIIPVDSIKWVSVRAGQDASVLWGDPRIGTYGRFNRFAAGFEDRSHYHSRDLRVVIISGTMIVRVATGASQEAGPGSFIMIPGGTPHTHSCKSGAACVLLVQQEGPNDNVPVNN